MPIPAKLSPALLFLVLGGAICMRAQTSPSAASAPAGQVAQRAITPDSSYPEQAYLSASRYVSQYFDFSFELPQSAELRPMPEPVARDGSIQLLELDGPPPADAEISIAAIPTASGSKQDAKTLLRYELDQELYRGVEELRGLSKANFGGHQFYLFETRRGLEQHVVLATMLGDYAVRVVLAAHDEKTVKQLEAYFEHLTFFAPADLRQYVESGARPYDGPAISSHRLSLLEADPPAKHIDPGKIQGDFYENPAIGFSYRVPQGWVLEAEGAVQPAIERDRARQDFGRPRMGRAEHRLMAACTRTLFSAWAKRPSADGQISYDDFGEVTVSAMSAACFPRMKFPESATDQQGARAFLLQFGLTHPVIDDMRDGKAFNADGGVFLYVHGTVGFQVPNDELSRRLSIAMVITERRGYVLTWFFAAPHDAELKTLTDERVLFDSAPPAQVVSASKGGGETVANPPAETAPTANSAATPPATTASSNSAATPRTAAASKSEPQPTSSANNSNAAAGQPASADGDPQQDTVTPTTRPSLLRPGETVQSQQGQGSGNPRQNQSQ